MTPALSTALELFQPRGLLSQSATEPEKIAWRQLNKIRASIMNDSWPDKIAAFRSLYGLSQHDRDVPGLLEKDRRDLHLQMLDEEFDEIAQASREDNLPEIVDGLLDLIYVALGTLLETGLTPTQINLLMEEVHASNLTKADETGKPIYNEAGKVQKGLRFVPPAIQQLLDGFIAGKPASPKEEADG